MNIHEVLEYIDIQYPEVEVEEYISDELPVGMLVIGGTYEEFGGICINLTYNMSTEVLDDRYHDYDSVCSEIMEVFEHEQRHAHQSSSRGFLDVLSKMMSRGTRDIAYYGDYDEIDAYGTVDLSYYVLRNGWESAFKDKMSILKTYIDLFGRGSKEVKVLIRKAYKVLDK